MEDKMIESLVTAVVSLWAIHSTIFKSAEFVNKMGASDGFQIALDGAFDAPAVGE